MGRIVLGIDRECSSYLDDFNIVKTVEVKRQKNWYLLFKIWAVEVIIYGSHRPRNATFRTEAYLNLNQVGTVFSQCGNGKIVALKIVTKRYLIVLLYELT